MHAERVESQRHDEEVLSKMTDEVHPFVKRVIDELDTMWENLTKVEVTAIKAASESGVMAARLRIFEQKLIRVEDENADLRAIIAQLAQEP